MSIPSLPAGSPDAFARVASNQPFILMDATAAWPLQAQLTDGGADAEPSVSEAALRAMFGETTAPVAAAAAAAAAAEYGAERASVPFGEYLDGWRRGSAESSVDGTDTLGSESTAPTAGGEPGAGAGYLKDFHFCLQRPEAEALYALPPPFADDWLNAWSLAGGRALADSSSASGAEAAAPAAPAAPDDYRFLYLGPKGSATPPHFDVLCSCSWSAQLAGRKRWQLREHEGVGEWSTVVQPPRSVMFVPSGWEHSVENLQDSLSINHNWFGKAAVGRCWAFLRAEAAATVAMLGQFEAEMDAEGPRVWVEHVVKVERANAGLSRRDLAELLLMQPGAEEARAILRELLEPLHARFLTADQLQRAKAAIIGRGLKLNAQLDDVPRERLRMRLADDARPPPAVALPSGFALVQFGTVPAATAASWAAVCAAAGEMGGDVAALSARFASEFGSGEKAEADLAARMFFALDAAGAAVGTATAWRDDGQAGGGRVHWVSVAPSAQGQGLAKALMAAVLRKLRELHPPPLPIGLSTQTTSARAIVMYLQLGFAPAPLGGKGGELSAEEASGWRALQKLFGVPLL